MSTQLPNKVKEIQEPSLLDALIPLLFMIALLAASIVLFGLDASLGPLQVSLLMSAVVAAVVAYKNGHSWERLGEEIVKGISLAMSAILILLMVGALIGVWNMSGTIATVMLTSIGFNIIAGDQYIAIVLPARMFMVEFLQRGLHPETLATAVENSGTVTSPMISWNSCGAYMSATLGVSTFTYFPYCFFNFINPILAMIFGFVGINVQRLKEEEPLPNEPMETVPLVALDK
jgi:Na+/H+ antiporter NhaC